MAVLSGLSGQVRSPIVCSAWLQPGRFQVVGSGVLAEHAGVYIPGLWGGRIVCRGWCSPVSGVVVGAHRVVVMDTSASRSFAARVPVVFAVAVLVVALDQGSKFWAESALAGRAPVPVLGEFLRLRLLYNSGAAFSIGAGSTWVFTIITAVAVVVLVRFALKPASVVQAVALSLLLGGAVTHLLDRLFRAPGFARGHVVDFIDYNGWFVGNVADIALFCGAVLLLITALFGSDPARGGAEDRGAEDGGADGPGTAAGR
nr:signal peptidase II [Kibdelosporangium phytohabitans]